MPIRLISCGKPFLDSSAIKVERIGETPPGGQETINWMGLVGYTCPDAKLGRIVEDKRIESVNIPEIIQALLRFIFPPFGIENLFLT